MVDFANVWAVARTESRLTRRLARFWVFGAVSMIFCLLAFINFWAIYFFGSAGSASAASTYPRFFMGAFGANFIFFMSAGLIFLAFDLRARDERERISEVLDSLPYSNTELVLGKFLGLLIPSWVAITVISLILVGMAAAMKTPIEYLSVVGVILFMAIPAYTFFLGLIFFFSSIFRNRLIVALAGIAFCIALWAVQRFWLPLYALPLLDVTGGFAMPFPSDIDPVVIEFPGLLQRVAFMLAGLGLLGFSIALHPRKDDGRPAAIAGAGAAMLVVGLAVLGLQAYQGKAIIDQKAQWKDAHAARAGEALPDVESVSGSITLDPGDGLAMQLSMTIAAREGETLSSALFTLNPGVVVAAARVDGEVREISHEDGMLEIALGRELGAGETATLEIEAAGRPDANFAYLDSALEAMELPGADGAILILGYVAVLDRPKIVALPEGAHWFPTAGPVVGTGPDRTRAADFFTVDLTVDAPEGWLVAGPGRRRPADAEAAGSARFRFTPGGPLPGVSLVAGRYESRSIELGGATLEMLVHAKHADVFSLFDDAGGEIRGWLEEKMTDAERYGLDYPYDGLTMVEVPNVFRGYGGGWRMDSTMIQPGMILMRESSFPTAYFERGWRDSISARWESLEGGLPEYKVNMLEGFFEGDLNGGNPFVAAARNFFGHVTQGEGELGLPLNYIFEDLSSRLLTERRGYFSYRMFDRNIGQDFQLAGQEMNNPQRIGDSYNEVLMYRMTSRPEVWEAVLDVSLVELDPWDAPEKTIDVLALKGGAMAQSMIDDMGKVKTGEYLAAVRSSSMGETFARDELLAAGEAVGEEIEPWLDTWLATTRLPGYRLMGVDVDRISDADDGTPRYQARVRVANDEPVPGMLKLLFVPSGEGRQYTDPYRVDGESAIEIGLVTSKPPTSLRIVPYLALNRDPFAAQFQAPDEEKIVEAEPFSGMREIPWEPAETGILVDDLDPGFSIDASGERTMMRVKGRGGDEVMDQGLPLTARLRAQRWSRYSSTANAFGRYRRTLALVSAGKGEGSAVFTAQLPESGRWEVEYYFARPTSRTAARLTPGNWKMQLVDSSGSRDITFDATGAEDGWNTLGTFEVAAGEARLVVSNESDGDYIVADAVRWSRPRGSGEMASR